MENDKHYLALLVANNAGVLSRVSSLFCQRGFNIDTLTVASTDREGISRITISFYGNEKVYAQLLKQTEKLIETKLIIAIEPQFCVLRELLLVKIEVNDKNRAEVEEFANTNKFKIVDTSVGSIVLERTGTPQKIDIMIELLSSYNVLELCRTGATALQRGHVTYNL